MKATTHALAAIVCACLLVACGQKGALYHPADKPTDSPAQSAPISQTTDGAVAGDTDY